MGWEWSDLTLGLQGESRIAKHKSAYKWLIIGPRALGWSFGVVLTLGLPLQGQTRIAKHKSAYNSFIIGPTALGL